VISSDRCVGAGSNGDLVLSSIVHDNQRDSRRFAGEDGDIADVDAFNAQFGDCGRTRVIVADGTDQMNLGSGARRGDRRIGSFPSAKGLQSATHHRLSWSRQPRRGHDEVDIDRADNDHQGRFATRHGFARSSCGD
jgi:hypothetical protein